MTKEDAEAWEFALRQEFTNHEQQIIKGKSRLDRAMAMFSLRSELIRMIRQIGREYQRASRPKLGGRHG